jgi:hypothetical protein
MVEGTDRRTEYKLLRRCQHVQRERDFILVPLALEPAEECGRVEHCGEEERGGGGQEDGGGERCGIEHVRATQLRGVG